MNRREFSTGILKTAAMLSFGAGFSNLVRAGQEKPGFGTVAGANWYKSGKPENAKVLLVSELTGEFRTAKPDAEWNFTFQNVPAGKYGIFLFQTDRSRTYAAEIEVKPDETVHPELTSGLWPLENAHVNRVYSPEPAYTLYLLSAVSDLVVVGRVGEIRKVPEDPDFVLQRHGRPPTWLPWDTEVDISIEKTFKGTFPGHNLTAIAMNYPPQSSGLFQPGNRVLLHLRKKTIEGMNKSLGENQYLTVFPDKAARVLPDGRDGEYEAFYRKHLARPSLEENNGYPTVEELIEDVKAPFSQWDASAFL